MTVKSAIHKVDTGQKAASIVKELGLGKSAGIVAVLLDEQCHLLDTVSLSAAQLRDNFDALSLVRAALRTGARGYVLVKTGDDIRVLSSFDVIRQLADLSHEYDVHFLDYVALSGSRVRDFPCGDAEQRVQSETPWNLL